MDFLTLPCPHLLLLFSIKFPLYMSGFGTNPSPRVDVIYGWSPKTSRFSGNYEVKEQYYIYDGNALIADIGGYFCMFLSLSRFLAALFEFLIMKNPKKKRKKSRSSSGQSSARTFSVGRITRF